jgi:hypothetical protein
MRGDVWLEKDVNGVVFVCIDKGNGRVVKKVIKKKGSK